MKPIIDTVYILFWGIISLVIIYQSLRKKPTPKDYKSYRLIFISIIMLYFIVVHKIFI